MLGWADVELGGLCIGFDLVKTTLDQGCVGGVAGDATLPGGHVTLDPVDVMSAVSNVALQNSYIGHLYQCNIGSTVQRNGGCSQPIQLFWQCEPNESPAMFSALPPVSKHNASPLDRGQRVGLS
jgi:hypothetical protein